MLEILITTEAIMFSLKIEHERQTDGNKTRANTKKIKKSRPAFHDISNLSMLSNTVTYLICYVKQYIIGSTKHQEHQII